MCCISSLFFVAVVRDHAPPYRALLCACGDVGLLVAMVDSRFFVLGRAPDAWRHNACVVVAELPRHVGLSATPRAMGGRSVCLLQRAAVCQRKQEAQLGGSMMSGGLGVSGMTGAMEESMEVETLVPTNDVVRVLPWHREA